MRCPKCHYLSFDPEPRCRNCGYDLEVADSELALRTAEPDNGPMPDLTLRERPSTSDTPLALELVHSTPHGDEFDQRTGYDDAPDTDEPPARPVEVDRFVPLAAPVVPAAESAQPAEYPRLAEAVGPVEPDESIEPDGHDEPDESDESGETEAPGEPALTGPRLALVDERPPASRFRGTLGSAVTAASDVAPEPPRAPFRSRHTTTTELPLFVKAIADREDLLDEAAAPVVVPPARPPLAVRRAVAEPATRSPLPERRLGPFDRDLIEDLKRVEREEAARNREEARAAIVTTESELDPVEPSRRALAAAADAAVLGGIGAFVLWATLKLCGIGLADMGVAALIPLAAFIAAVVVTYLFMFTAAGGQTVGKMWMGIRVVADQPDSGEPLSVRQASWRAALSIVSVVSLGLGWVPALFGRGMTLHDRLAHTRVVRA